MLFKEKKIMHSQYKTIFYRLIDINFNIHIITNHMVFYNKNI